MKNFQLFFRVAETDNIGKRILEILKEKKIKPTPFEDEIDISRGYIKRAAENSTGLGSEIVEKILLKFPDINAFWLITGIHLSINTDENLTGEPKPMDINKLQDDLRIAKGMLAFIDEQKTELQRKYDKLEFEADGLRKENATLKDQLKKTGSAKNKSD